MRERGHLPIGGATVKPLAIFGAVVVVGLIAIEVGLRATAHTASATPPPTPLTQAQFVQRGNAVCAVYNRSAKAVLTPNPKTFRAATRELQRWMPLVQRDVAGLRALVPPVSDDATYRSLLAVMTQEDAEVHSILHDFETGQYQRGVLLLRQGSHLDNRFNSLARTLGLTACATTARPTGSGSRSGSASKGGRPALAGRYLTDTRVVAVHYNTAVHPGEESSRMWTFIPQCSSANCAITLLRPSILPGSMTVYKYTLRPISATSYRGSRTDPASCQVRRPNGTLSVLPNSFLDHTTITVHATRVSDGKVIAYAGTFLFRAVPQPAARRHGCRWTGRQWIEFLGARR